MEAASMSSLQKNLNNMDCEKHALTHPCLRDCVVIASNGGKAVRFQSFRMRVF